MCNKHTKRGGKGVLTHFAQTIRDNKWFSYQDRVLIAVSGGVDSVVLLDCMCTLPQDIRPIIAIAHINHQLRDTADQEALGVQQLADRYGVDYYSCVWHEGKHVSSNIEMEARLERYRFFEQVMNQHAYSIVLTAHHQDDQAETVLMKLIRGGLLEEKVGIPKVRSFGPGKLIRPLLAYTKRELYDYAKQHQLSYWEDASNQTDTFLRNRLRHQVMPLLETENAKAVEHICDFATELYELLSVYQPHLDKVVSTVAQVDHQTITLHIPRLLSYPTAVQKIVIKQLLKTTFCVTGPFKKQYILDLLQWISHSQPNSQLIWADNWQCRRSYDVVMIYPQLQCLNNEGAKLDDVTVSLSQAMLNQWHRLSTNDAFGIFEYHNHQWHQGDDVMILSKEAIRWPITLRHRQPGDRMSYKGGVGHKKIKAILINKKIPKPVRDRVWLVVDANQEILWCVNYQESRLSNPAIPDTMKYVFAYQHI